MPVEAPVDLQTSLAWEGSRLHDSTQGYDGSRQYIPQVYDRWNASRERWDSIHLFSTWISISHTDEGGGLCNVLPLAFFLCPLTVFSINLNFNALTNCFSTNQPHEHFRLDRSKWRLGSWNLRQHVLGRITKTKVSGYYIWSGYTKKRLFQP